MSEQLVARRSADGSLRVSVEPLVPWRVAGASPPEPPEAVGPVTEHDVIRLKLAEAGIGPQPVVSFADDDDGRQVHLTWPDPLAEDPELARVVALASLPLGHECSELRDDEWDEGLEQAVEQQAAADRELRADRPGVVAAFAACSQWAIRLRRTPSASRRRVELEQDGGVWREVPPRQSSLSSSGGRLRPRARLRRRS